MKRRNRVISFVLAFCLIISTTTIVFADNFKESNQIVKTEESSFILNDEEYNIVKDELNNIIETKMYDSQKNLVGHMKYNKSTGQLVDIFNNKIIETEYGIVDKSLRLIDDEGYYYQGDYTINLGIVSGAASLILALVTHGYTLSLAQTIVGSAINIGSSAFYIEVELWMKSDEEYDYVKKIESVYELISENNYKIAGPYTFYQKKAI
ncbi:MAG: hypothetical protein R6U59_08895 [Eubacteriales bacterium]